MTKSVYLTARLSPSDARLARLLADQVARGNRSAAIRQAIRETAARHGLDRPTTKGGNDVPRS